MDRIKFAIFISISIICSTFAFADKALYEEALWQEARKSFDPLPEKPAFKSDNPGNEAKIKLGKMLYFDKRLSASNVFSCNSCHDLALGGADNSSFSIGHNWLQGGRNAPTVFNAWLQFAQFWDGRAKDVEEQAGMPITNPVEMNATEEMVVLRLGSIPQYVELFEKAFPAEKPSLTYKNVAKSIGAFERTLITPSRFDDYLKGDANALSKVEKEGMKLMMDKGCVICHSGSVLGGDSFKKFGVFIKPEFLADTGRFEVTKNEKDMFVFKVPTLRNIELTYPYFSDGSVWELSEAVAIMAEAQLGKKLSDDETSKIVSFLKTLTGRRLNIDLPSLPPSTSATSRPATD